MAFFLAIASLLFGWTVARRWLNEPDPILCAGLTPMLGAVALIAGANWLERPQMVWWGASLLALAGLARWKWPAPDLEFPSLNRGQQAAFLIGCVAVIGYTVYSQARFIDTDNWIHEPLIATYMRGVFPPVHPFFPDVSMNGHYGRDLLMAVLTPDLADPFTTVRWVNVVLQLATFLALFGLIRRFDQSATVALTGTYLAFFGICVGFRVGLVDSFDGNNGIVYALLVGLFYLMARVLELDGISSKPPLWLVAGVYLGTYQLVYETHFGLMLLTGLCLALLFVREKRVWAGVSVVLVVAVTLACVEGGPFTDLAKRAGQSEQDVSQQNVAQHVSVTFPKADFLRVLVTTADYQRLSVAYKSGLFREWAPAISGEGYMLVVDPRFLYAHWLPLYLAPLTLFCLARARNRIGLAFWIFGIWAYLTPAMVDFGEIYEWEYFRWEFAAGFGWAVALGICLAQEGFTVPKPFEWENLEQGGRLTFRDQWWRPTVGVVVLVACLAAGEKLLNDAVIDYQKTRLPLFESAADWRVRQTELGVTHADMEAMAWLAQRLKPGQRILSNLGEETPAGLWPDSVLATRTGGHPAGHARPPRDRRVHAHPNFYRNGTAKAFYQSGRLDLLEGQADWLYLDLDKGPQVNNDEGSPVFQDAQGHRRQIWPLMARPRAEGSGQIQNLKLEADPRELRPGTLYRLSTTVTDPVGWTTTRLLDNDGIEVVEPIRHWLTPEIPTLYLCTPLEEGEYRLEVGERTLPVVVDYFERLARLKVRVDLPDSLRPKQFGQLRVGLTSPDGLQIQAPTSLLVRWKRIEGDYVWELDRVAYPVELMLEPEKETHFELEIFSPWETGGYQVELSLRDDTSARVVPLGSSFGPIPVR